VDSIDEVADTIVSRIRLDTSNIYLPRPSTFYHCGSPAVDNVLFGASSSSSDTTSIFQVTFTAYSAGIPAQGLGGFGPAEATVLQ